MAALRKALLLLAAALLVWRIAATGMAAHYAERLKGGDREAAGKALAWSPRQPEALYRLAADSRGQSPDATAGDLRRAFAENPADTRPLLAMASLTEARGEPERAEALLRAAVALAPSDPRVHKRAAAFWVARGEVERSLRHWSRALENDPSQRKDLFPLLLKLAEDPRTRAAFKPLADEPPSWWADFFAQVASDAQDPGSVRELYDLRRASPQAPVSPPERRAYVARLKKDGVVAAAYVDWINGLTREQRARLALLYDGGFELEPGNWGFGWEFRSTPRALVDRARSYGVDGETALHLLFDNHEGVFQAVSQSLFLDPGRFRLTGKVRTDSLQTDGGLKWVVRCLLRERADLGESERFLGSNEWRDFAFEFEVPATCILQEIRLISAGTRTFEHKITGGAWFDRLAIRKMAKLAAANGSHAASPSPTPSESTIAESPKKAD